MKELLGNYAHIITPMEYLNKIQFIDRIKEVYSSENSITNFFIDQIKSTDFLGFFREITGGIKIIYDATSLYMIDGYWVDGKSEFSGFVVSSSEDIIEEMDDAIFYYGLTERDMKEPEETQLKSGREFVVTSFIQMKK